MNDFGRNNLTKKFNHHQWTQQNNCLEHRKRLAKKINQKRILEKYGKHKNNTSHLNLVHRNHNETPYKLCTFLGDHDIILATNDMDCIDIIQFKTNEEIVNNNNENNDEYEINNYMSSSVDDTTSCKYNPNQQQKSFTTTTKGTTLCTSYKVSSHKVGDQCSKIQSIHEGKYFVVGMDSGDMQIFETDLVSTSSLPTSCFLNKSSKNIHLHNQTTFLRNKLYNSGPFRRYQRNNDFTLAYQFRNQHDSSYNLKSELTEIFNDGTEYSHYTDLPYIRCSQSCWDFRSSNSSSSMLVEGVHVSRYADSFYLRMPDYRQQQNNNGNMNQQQNNNSVCVDVDMNGNSFLSGVCFVAENLIATSVVNCKHGTLRSTSSSVKLWDIRYMKKSNGFISDITVLAYPKDNVVGMKTKAVWNCPVSSIKEESQCFDIMTEQFDELISTTNMYEDGHSLQKIIVNITPFDNYGNILVTSKCPVTYSEEYTIIDPISLSVVGKAEVGDLPNQSGSSFSSLATNAVNKEHGLIALYGSDTKSVSTLSFHLSNNYRNKTEIDRTRIRKRKLTNSCNNHLSMNTLHADVKDRYGLQSQLSSLAFNDSGSKIAATTLEGDIFVW